MARVVEGGTDEIVHAGGEHHETPAVAMLDPQHLGNQHPDRGHEPSPGLEHDFESAPAGGVLVGPARGPGGS